MLLIFACHYPAKWDMIPIVVKIGIFGRYAIDGFLVLCGYFTMKKILIDKDKGQWSLRKFYLGRSVRILPLYYFVLLFVLYIAPLFSMSNYNKSKDFSLLFREQFFLWGCLTNFLSVAKGQYLQYGISIYWYIAVIMQFYVLWPIAASRLSLSAIKKTSICLIMCSIISRFVFSAMGFSNMQIYQITLCRLDSLFAGVLMAVLLYEKRTCRYILAWTIGSMGMALFAAIAFYSVFPGAPVLMSFTVVSFLAATILFFLASEGYNFIKHIFSFKLFVMFGKYSYGVYVFHLYVAAIFLWLTDTFVRVPKEVFIIAGVGASLICGVFSAHLIEQPLANLLLKRGKKCTSCY